MIWNGNFSCDDVFIFILFGCLLLYITARSSKHSFVKLNDAALTDMELLYVIVSNIMEGSY